MNYKKAHLYIIGAGFAGQMIARDIERKKIFGSVAAFLDDDKNLIGTKIDGIPVLGPIDNTASLLRCDAQDEAIIAIPSVDAKRIREIYDALKAGGFLKIKILPSVSQIVDGKVHLIQTREIDPLDVLGRTPVTISLQKSLAYLRGKRVLITGAGGSIGSEISRQLLSGGAERLYLLGHGENSIVKIYRELEMLRSEGVGEKATVVPILGDLKDFRYTNYIVEKTRADVIFHCAAYKHVPMMEENPVAAIENNVFGTKNILDAALSHNVARFVLISTDKAVNPCNVYGVSKMISEKLVLAAAKKAQNHKNERKNQNQAFMFVRFGNVLGSRGSILPIFMEQIKSGGPITVTNPKMERFFMTIPEACSLVLKIGGIGENASSYLLDMGEPIKILELAKQAIFFSGLEPYKDVDIKIIGTRPGERIEEKLWTKDENPQKTEHEKILKLKSSDPTFDLEKLLQNLTPICFFDEKNKTLFRNKDALFSQLQNIAPNIKNPKKIENTRVFL